MVKEHKLTVSRTAHYCTIGEAGKHVEDFWIVCHGYGQVAKYFIRKFDVLDNDKTLIVAPEGMNHFYWHEKDRHPVATWMTSMHRLDEIADYTHYIKTLYDYFVPQLSDNVRIHLLGFSQGTATQCRWILREQPVFHRLILWAGLLPDDLDFKKHNAYLSDKEILFVYGTKDRYINEEKRLQWQFDYAQKNDLALKTVVFEGPHVMVREVLKEINKK